MNNEIYCGYYWLWGILTTNCWGRGEIMNVTCGYSTQKNPFKAVEQATAQITDPKMILYFCPYETFEQITEVLNSKYPNCMICGSSTLVAYHNDMNWDADPNGIGLTVTAFGDDFDCVVGAIENVGEIGLEDCREVRRKFDEIGVGENTICFEMMNYTGMEENALTVLVEALRGSGVEVVGGCAGHEHDEIETAISYNGKIYKNGCVYLFIHSRCGRIDIVRGDICKPTRREGIATDVDVLNRIVYEFDGIPAAEALADELNLSVDELNGKLAGYPIGRYADNELNIIELAEVTPEHGLRAYASVYGGIKYKLLERGDYEKRMDEFCTKMKDNSAEVRFGLFVICTSITHFFLNESWIHNMTKSFDEIVPMYVGMTGWGEQNELNQLNQSMIAILFEENV